MIDTPQIVLCNWMSANKHTTKAVLWERYLVGPDANPDPSAWQTELNWPIAD